MFEATGIVHWVGLGVTMLVGAVTSAAMYGALVARLKAAEKTIEALSTGREKQGERVGVLEERVAHLEGRLSERR